MDFKFINLKQQVFLLAGFSAIMLFASCNTQPTKQTNECTKTLKHSYEGKFYIGTALDSSQIIGEDTAAIKVIKQQFNSIVAENCMKSMYLQPEQGKFYFAEADAFVDFGSKNNMKIIGHTLIWHSQAPKWFFTDAEGNEVSRDTLIARIKNHIYTVVGRYKGRIAGWDVVNEAIEDDGTYRKSKFYNIIGPEYINLAFKFAHEADPEAELYYNDYSMPNAGKRDGVVKMVKGLKADGLRIDGIGMQAHYDFSFPTIEEFSQAIDSFASTGAKVMITELDISVLPSPFENNTANISEMFALTDASNPYANGLPDSVQMAFGNRYVELFEVLLAKQDKIDRVTLWGVNDDQSWKNNWPIWGRTDYPLLFDRNNNPKPVVEQLINLTKETEL